jgi:hypothetical protein
MRGSVDFSRVRVDNKCCKCGQPIMIMVLPHLTKMMEETDQAICHDCEKLSKWRRVINDT